MRQFVTLLLLILPVTAFAQDQTSSRPILKIVGDYSGLTAEDRNAYCFWAGQLYSIGSSFCTRQQTASTCTEVPGKRPIWVTKENDKFCDRNQSMTPQ